MKIMMVAYRVRKDKIREVERAIKKFVAAVRKEPGTIFYESYKETDGVSFVHFMSFKDGKSEASHRNAAHTKEFADALYPSCVEKPVFTTLKVITQKA